MNTFSRNNKNREKTKEVSLMITLVSLSLLLYLVLLLGRLFFRIIRSIKSRLKAFTVINEQSGTSCGAFLVLMQSFWGKGFHVRGKTRKTRRSWGLLSRHI